MAALVYLQIEDWYSDGLPDGGLSEREREGVLLAMTTGHLTPYTALTLEQLAALDDNELIGQAYGALLQFIRSQGPAV